MFTRILPASLVTTVVFVIFSMHQALAVPTLVDYQDVPQHCDTLLIPQQVDEIGDLSIFPSDESLTALHLGASPIVPCPMFDNPILSEEEVEITNFTGKAWDNVWYVANRETSITNFDGVANGIGFPAVLEAFRIDNAISDPGGTHHPLVSESGLPNGIWDIGESWVFVLQDYTNALGLSPDAITSIGVGDASVPSGLGFSSGSIIATPFVPEPASMALALFGLVSLVVPRLRGANRTLR